VFVTAAGRLSLFRTLATQNTAVGGSGGAGSIGRGGLVGFGSAGVQGDGGDGGQGGNGGVAFGAAVFGAAPDTTITESALRDGTTTTRLAWG
jgi:hypothetical protein